MVALSKALASFSKKNILVVGDLILDKYVFGCTKRISPEAPVPVVVVEKEETKAGGAGNVVLNLVSMGMNPRVVGRVGNDPAGHQLIDLLNKELVDTSGILLQENYCTPVKKRIIASSQQLLRVDKEHVFPVSEDIERTLVERIPEFLRDISLVLISDYAKGSLTHFFLKTLIVEAKKRNISCISDPKGTDFRKYTGSMFIKPNAHETLLAAPPHAGSSIEDAAHAILKIVDIEYLMVTRSEEGISLFQKDGTHELFPVTRKEVIDVTGAGDTVLAMLGASLASNVSIHESISLSNIAASCAVERLGCARVSMYDVACKLIEQNPSGKICSAESFEHLLLALKGEKLMMIRVPQINIRADDIIKLAQIASSDSSRRAIVCFEHPINDQGLLNLIASLQSIDLVVHGCGSIPIFQKSDHKIVVV